MLDIIEIFLINCTDNPKTFKHEFFSRGGFTWYGGFISVLILLFVLSFFIKRKVFYEFLDKFSLTVCLGYSVGRLACLFSGDGCFGKYTALPWGMYFPYGVSPNVIPVHPTPLYESICSLILFIFLKKVDSRKRFIGQTFVYYLFLSSMVRFLIEFVRINPIYKFGLTLSQWVALLLIFFSFGEFIWLKRNLQSNEKPSLTPQG